MSNEPGESASRQPPSADDQARFCLIGTWMCLGLSFITAPSELSSIVTFIAGGAVISRVLFLGPSLGPLYLILLIMAFILSVVAFIKKPTYGTTITLVISLVLLVFELVLLEIMVGPLVGR